MNSAFGIDHGEISKAAPPRLPRSRSAQRLGQLVRMGGTKGGSRGRKIVDTPLSVSGLGRATGRGVGRVSDALDRASVTLQHHGGATGAAVVGTGVAGAGYGYKRALNKKPPKKNKFPKAM